MAGPNPAGLDDSFLSGIRTAMQLGLPTDPERRPVFTLPATPDNGEDQLGLPWDISDSVENTVETVEDVLCALEFKAPGSNIDDKGGVIAQQATLIVTLLQDEYDQVKTSVSVTVGGSTFRRWFDAPDLALGTYGVYQLYFQAGDLA